MCACGIQEKKFEGEHRCLEAVIYDQGIQINAEEIWLVTVEPRLGENTQRYQHQKKTD